MHFLFPTFLWALGALMIPIIIHLFHFRRFKKVYFTNVHLLKEIKEETSTRSRLRNLLVLLTRMAALAFLVFAFAQPIISNQDIDNNQNQVVSIIIDNSFSMNALQSEVPLLTRAVDRAKQIVSAHNETDQFLVLTPELKTKHLRLLDQKTALTFIEEIQSTADIKELENITDVAKRIMSDEEGRKSIYILSDFQENISEYDSPIDSLYQVYLMPMRAVQENNVAIVDATFESPVPMLDISNKLIVTLQNYSSTDQSVQLSMNYEGQNRPQGVIEIPGNSIAVDTLSITIDNPGWHDVLISIEDYPVSFDDELYLSFYLKPQIQILNIRQGRDNEFLDKAFSSTAYYQLEQANISQIRYDRFTEKDLIILDDLTTISSGLKSELSKYVSNGGNLLIFPSESAQTNDYNALLAELNADRLGNLQNEEKSVSRINIDEFVFNDVFENKRRNLRLPTVNKFYGTINSQQAIKESILTYRDGNDYITKYIKGYGQTYLCSAPLDERINELVSNAEIFIPLLYRVAISSATSRKLFYTIDQDEIISIDKLDNSSQGNYIVSGPSEFIPSVIVNQGQSIVDIRDQIKQSGYYQLTLDDKVLHHIAYNYDRTESDVTYGNLESINQGIAQRVEIINPTVSAEISSIISAKNSGIPLWRWCLIIALVFLLIETLLLRVWKAS